MAEPVWKPETLRRIEENGISTQIVELLAWKYKLDVNDLDAIFERAAVDAADGVKSL